MSLVETEELQRRIGALEAENARLRELAIDDNTELERAEAALADSEQRYRTLSRKAETMSRPRTARSRDRVE